MVIRGWTSAAKIVVRYKLVISFSTTSTEVLDGHGLSQNQLFIESEKVVAS